jgi:hypothetical protein
MSQPVSRGTLESCPCPWCGFKLDFSDVPLVEGGNVFSCDKCRRMIEIVKKQAVTVIYLRQSLQTTRTFQKR